MKEIKFEKGKCYACERDTERQMLYRDGRLVHEGVCNVCAPYLKQLYRQIWGRFRYELTKVCDMHQLVGLGKHIVGEAKPEDFAYVERLGFNKESLQDHAESDTDLHASLLAFSEADKIPIFRCLLSTIGIKAHRRPIDRVEIVDNETLMQIKPDDQVFFENDKDLSRDYNRMTASMIIRKIRECLKSRNIAELRKYYVEATKRQLEQTRQYFLRAFKEIGDRRWNVLAVDFTAPSSEMVAEIQPNAKDLKEKFEGSEPGNIPVY